MALVGVTLGNTQSTDLSLAKPAGTFDEHVAYYYALSDGNPLTVTWPTGFSETPVSVISPLSTQVLDNQVFRCARKICAGEPATWAASSNINAKFGVIVLSGRDIIAPEHRISGRADTTTLPSQWTGTSDAFATPTTLGGCDILMFMAEDIDNPLGSVVHEAPAGFTIIAEHSGATFFQSAVFIKENAPGGETGVYAAKGTLATVNTNLALGVIAVAPDIPQYPDLAPHRSIMAPLLRRSA